MTSGSQRRPFATARAYGIALVPERFADSPTKRSTPRGSSASRQSSKSAMPGAHKTETGCRPGLHDDADAVAVGGRGGSAARSRPADDLGGVELLAGIAQDPLFGPLVAFGPGGVYAELIGDVGFRIAPLTDVDAEELVTAVAKPGRLVAGFRGRPGPMPRDSSTFSTAFRGSVRTSRKSESSTSTRSSG